MVQKRSSWHIDNYDGVITHLEPDILECEVKWTLGSLTTNKANGCDGILAELFQILKDNVVKVLHSICQQIWKIQRWPQAWKMSVFIPIPKKGNGKECSNYCTTTLISHTSKVMLKILQVRLQQHLAPEHDVQRQWEDEHQVSWCPPAIPGSHWEVLTAGSADPAVGAPDTPDRARSAKARRLAAQAWAPCASHTFP